MKRENSSLYLPGLFFELKKVIITIICFAIIVFSCVYIGVNTFIPTKYSVQGGIATIAEGDLSATFRERSITQGFVKYQSLLDSDVFKSIVWENVEGGKRTSDEINIVTVENSTILYLQGVSDSPARAYEVAKAGMDNYQRMFDYANGSYSLQTVSKPSADRIEIVSNYSLLISFAASVLVICIGGFVVIVRYLISDKIYNSRQAKERVDGRLIGSISHSKNKDTSLISNPLTSVALVNDFKSAATNIDYLMKKNNHNILMVTSYMTGEGKTSSSINLSLTLANLNKKVLLMDLDLRNPTVFKYTNMSVKEDDEVGDVLLRLSEGNNTSNVNNNMQHIQYSDELNIHYLVGSKKFQNDEDTILSGLDLALKALKDKFDYIIIDASPTGIVSETYLKATIAEEVLLIVRKGIVDSKLVNEVISDFKSSNIKFLGFLFNDEDDKTKS